MKEQGWRITEHCCRSCFGGVLKRGDVFRCSTCSAETTGSVEAICGCGTPGFKGLAKCGPNPKPTPENPFRIMIHVGRPAEGTK